MYSVWKYFRYGRLNIVYLYTEDEMGGIMCDVVRECGERHDACG